MGMRMGMGMGMRAMQRLAKGELARARGREGVRGTRNACGRHADGIETACVAGVRTGGGDAAVAKRVEERLGQLEQAAVEEDDQRPQHDREGAEPRQLFVWFFGVSLRRGVARRGSVRCRSGESGQPLVRSLFCGWIV